MSDQLSHLDYVTLYGDRADDAKALHEALGGLEEADTALLEFGHYLDALTVRDTDGDLSEPDRADIRHELATARRAIRNLGRIAVGHATDLRELASQEIEK